jgi:Asp-tRNA(Asn)/Glu-tRNA(Gln) amidotransferase A subunit family amidase
MTELPLVQRSAEEIKKLVLENKYTPVEVASAFLERIEEQNPSLSAFLHIRKEEALQDAKKIEEQLKQGQNLPLAGVPLAIMDNLHVKGCPSTFGSVLLQGHIAEEDSLIVKRLRAAGAIIVGKTNMPEFGLYPATENKLAPPCVNPHHKGYSAGGSSGGAACAVAANLCAAAIGTDIHGGIRIPASFCGLFGLKPSRGKIPFAHGLGVPQGERILLHDGVLARTTVDLDLVMSVLAKPDSLDHESYFAEISTQKQNRKKRTHFSVSYSDNFGYITVEEEVQKNFDHFKKQLKESSHTLTPSQITFDSHLLEQFCDIVSVDKYLATLSIAQQNGKKKDAFCDYTKWWMNRAMSVSGMHYALSFIALEWVKKQLDDALSTCDVLITPTCPVSPFLIADLAQINAHSQIHPLVGLWAFTIVCNMSGYPALNIPCGNDKNGLPFGIQAIGKYGDEETLLEFAATL